LCPATECRSGNLALRKKNAMKKWSFFDSLSQRINDVLILLILVSAVVIMESGLLYLIKTGWGLYLYTAVGDHYLNRYGAPGLMRFIDAINIIDLTLKTTLISVGISLIAAVLGRFLGLSSHLYVNKRLPVRILLWGLPIAWLSALTLQQTGMGSTLLTSFFLTLFPSIGLQNQAFRLAQGTVPELELLLTAYPPLAQLWEGLSRFMSLIFVSTVISVMVLYLLSGLLESGFRPLLMPPFRIQSLP